MLPADFDRLVNDAYERIPPRFRRRLKNLAMIVEAEPSAAQLARGRVPRGNTLLGLYEGRPLTQRSVFESFAMPDRITIFQGPHERGAIRPISPNWGRYRLARGGALFRDERAPGARRRRRRRSK